MVYETIYSHQDKKDDVFAGVKSMALLFGDTTKPWISGFAVALIANLACAGYSASLGKHDSSVNNEDMLISSFSILLIISLQSYFLLPQ